MDEKSQEEIEYEKKIGLHMKIYLTEFIYPLSKPISMSQELGIEFDNPRSEEELEFIKSKIIPAIKNRQFDSFFPKKNKFELTDLARKIVQGFPENIQSRYTDIESDTGLIDMLSTSWCIVRYSHQADHSYWFRSTKGLDVYEIKNYGRELVRDICCALSFLLKLNEDFVGSSFLLEEKDDTDEIRHSILLNSQYHDDIKGAWRHQRFGKIEEKFTKLSNLIDSQISSPSEDKILYVGGVLRSINEACDFRIEILNLVSVLELFVAHTPDSQRFNIEDSIGKQFRTKIALLARDISPSLEELGKELKHIYNIRSKIAHGDFIELKKELSKKTAPPDLKEAMYDIVIRLYDIVREVFLSSLRDPELAKFLKNT